MLVDTQPATHQHIPASPEVRDQWVSVQLIGVLMDNLVPALATTAMTWPVLIVMLLGDVNSLALGAWSLLLLSLLVYRYRLLGVYHLRYDSSEGPRRPAFIARYLWTWAATGALWSGAVLLCYLRASEAAQFVCGMLVVGQGVVSLTTLAVYWPVFRITVATTSATVLAAMIANTWLIEGQALMWPRTLALASLLLGFTWALLIAGRRINQTYRSSFELQFSNQELIDSLTQQTRASIRAVTAKNRFLASAAHDLRQPVHALSLYADWLATEPEMARDIAPRILQSTRAINELFDSLFDLTRIDAGNYKVRLQHVDVRQLFNELRTQFEPVAAGKSLQLRTRTRPATLWADPVVLRRILGNLLSNAIRHTQRGGVLVSLRRREGLMVFEVWDTGVGIAREHQQAIFQEFFRVSQHQGTEDSLGLGLTIVSKLATLMGYQLSLNSQARRGSVFRVVLPGFTQRVSDPLAQAGDALSARGS